MIQVDINDINDNVTPPRLRSYEFQAMLRAFSAPTRLLLLQFYAQYEKRKYEMSFNGQVIYLEHLLNDKFDLIQRRIHIGNYSQGMIRYLFNVSELNEPIYIFNKSEAMPPVYFHNAPESSYSFVIYVPAGAISNYDEFRGWVDRYKLKSKTYLIIEE